MKINKKQEEINKKQINKQQEEINKAQLENNHKRKRINLICILAAICLVLAAFFIFLHSFPIDETVHIVKKTR